MPPPAPTPQDPPPTRPPIKKSTTMAPCQNRIQQHARNLIGCVWQFNNCIEEKYQCRHSEDICYQRFDDCKMLVMGKIKDTRINGQEISKEKSGAFDSSKNKCKISALASKSDRIKAIEALYFSNFSCMFLNPDNFFQFEL